MTSTNGLQKITKTDDLVEKLVYIYNRNPQTFISLIKSLSNLNDKIIIENIIFTKNKFLKSFNSYKILNLLLHSYKYNRINEKILGDLTYFLLKKNNSIKFLNKLYFNDYILKYQDKQKILYIFFENFFKDKELYNQIINNEEIFNFLLFLISIYDIDFAINFVIKNKINLKLFLENLLIYNKQLKYIKKFDKKDLKNFFTEYNNLLEFLAKIPDDEEYLFKKFFHFDYSEIFNYLEQILENKKEREIYINKTIQISLKYLNLSLFDEIVKKYHVNKNSIFKKILNKEYISELDYSDLKIFTKKLYSYSEKYNWRKTLKKDIFFRFLKIIIISKRFYGFNNQIDYNYFVFKFYLNKKIFCLFNKKEWIQIILLYINVLPIFDEKEKNKLEKILKILYIIAYKKNINFSEFQNENLEKIIKNIFFYKENNSDLIKKYLLKILNYYIQNKTKEYDNIIYISNLLKLIN